MKKLLSLLTITLITISGYPQDQHLIDSLQADLNNATQDSTRAIIFFELSKAY